MASSKKSVWTAANIVTMVRVVLMPVWLLVAELISPYTNGAQTALIWLPAVFYIFLSLTDKVDGYLARSRGEVTNFGKFLDPIADKLLVVVSLSFLLEYQQISAWVLLIVVAREFLVSGLRMVVATEGIVIAASNLGKWKTATTMLAISLYLLKPLVSTAFIAPFMLVAQCLLLVAVVLTAISGIDYFVKSWPALAKSED